MPNSLYAGEIVYDDFNSHALRGDGHSIIVGGERRLFSRTRPPMSANPRDFSVKFEDVAETIPRDEWGDRIKEQLEKMARVSDFQDFPPHDQRDGPLCWANGPAHAMTTVRVMQGAPYVEMSAASVAVPISGGHQGGWEGDALKYGAKYGFVSSLLWPNTSTDRSLMRNEACQLDRENHKNMEWIDLGNRFENYATAALNVWPGAVAYNDWSHVVSVCDLVLLDDGHFALRIRNNSGKWGAANRFGQYGYAVFREGARTHGCPDSGFGLRVVTSSIK